MSATIASASTAMTTHAQVGTLLLEWFPAWEAGVVWTVVVWLWIVVVAPGAVLVSVVVVVCVGAVAVVVVVVVCVDVTVVVDGVVVVVVAASLPVQLTTRASAPPASSASISRPRDRRRVGIIVTRFRNAERSCRTKLNLGPWVLSRIIHFG
jgi:hypothetical protein